MKIRVQEGGIMIMVSACLLGANCKYNGGNNKNQKVIDYLKDKNYIPVCPESESGMKSPRVPSEIESKKTSKDVLNGNAKVFSKTGEDVTEYFLKGAKIALEKAIKNGVEVAILKEKSPSCGSKQVYDGSFNDVKIEGMGVTARLLEENNIKVVNENLEGLV